MATTWFECPYIYPFVILTGTIGSIKQMLMNTFSLFAPVDTPEIPKEWTEQGYVNIWPMYYEVDAQIDLFWSLAEMLLAPLVNVVIAMLIIEYNSFNFFTFVAFAQIMANILYIASLGQTVFISLLNGTILARQWPMFQASPV